MISELLYDKDWYKELPMSGDINIEVADTNLLNKNIEDKLSLFSGPRMFVPASLSLVMLEL